MNYYLLRRETYFLDGHGSPDDGGKDLSVVATNLEIDTTKEYRSEIHDLTQEELEEDFSDYLLNEDEWTQAEDGYNNEEYIVVYKKLTEQEYMENLKIIGAYDKILNF